jgi:hypothetical protein
MGNLVSGFTGACVVQLLRLCTVHIKTSFIVWEFSKYVCFSSPFSFFVTLHVGKKKKSLCLDGVNISGTRVNRV